MLIGDKLKLIIKVAMESKTVKVR